MPEMPTLPQPPTGVGREQAGPAGRYCNHTFVSNSKFDFMFDFFQLIPRVGPPSEDGTTLAEARLIERIIMSPQHARAFLQVLTDNFQRWESTYGQLPELPNQ